MAKAKEQTIGALLPASQAKLLTPKMRKMTKSQIEKAVNQHPNHTLDHKDVASLRKLAIERINNGQSVMTWSSHKLTAHEVNPQDPSTCFCL